MDQEFPDQDIVESLALLLNPNRYHEHLQELLVSRHFSTTYTLTASATVIGKVWRMWQYDVLCYLLASQSGL